MDKSIYRVRDWEDDERFAWIVLIQSRQINSSGDIEPFALEIGPIPHDPAPAGDFGDGSGFPQPMPNLFVRVTLGDDPSAPSMLPDAFQSSMRLGVWCISTRARRLFEEIAAEDFVFHPVPVKVFQGFGDINDDDFRDEFLRDAEGHIADVVGFIDAIESGAEVGPGRHIPMELRPAIFRSAVIGRRAFFRAKKAPPMDIYCTGWAKAAWEAKGFGGLTFEPVGIEQ